MDVLRSNYLPGSEPGLLPVLAHQTPVQVRHAETVRLDLPDAIAAAASPHQGTVPGQGHGTLRCMTHSPKLPRTNDFTNQGFMSPHLQFKHFHPCPGCVTNEKPIRVFGAQPCPHSCSYCPWAIFYLKLFKGSIGLAQFEMYHLLCLCLILGETAAQTGQLEPAAFHILLIAAFALPPPLLCMCTVAQHCSSLTWSFHIPWGFVPFGIHSHFQDEGDAHACAFNFELGLPCARSTSPSHFCPLPSHLCRQTFNFAPSFHFLHYLADACWHFPCNCCLQAK